ncbi:polysaccharide biosynthesis/export family protein [Caulobacter sp. S45]|uniref:polysaccharide biosynthesis/export family protein n=1 Tax=Caulobacter sp. S45 TaxID=1641861 RepID=UPI0015762BB7|nr:polysaccharide biosynthesis/export family protein [Caulobacter sp. S45]
MRKGLSRLTLAVALSVAGASAPLTATAQTGAVAPVSASASSGPADPKDMNYHLGAADKLRVIVFEEAGLSGEFVISDTGEIAFPLIGNVHAAGLTVAQVQEALRSRLADGLLRDPHVSVEVEMHRPFYILGEVQKPGEYPFTNGLTVLNAVATAGGFTYRANTRIVTIRHAGALKAAPVRLTDASEVGPGDTILIRERFF